MADKWSSKPRIAVSRDLKESLDSWKKPSETYESVLERLLEEAERDGGNSSRGTDEKTQSSMIRSIYNSVDSSRIAKKTTSRVGNGAHVHVPRDWDGELVLAILLEGEEKHV